MDSGSAQVADASLPLTRGSHPMGISVTKGEERVTTGKECQLGKQRDCAKPKM